MFCRQYFQMHFLEKKVIFFIKIALFLRFQLIVSQVMARCWNGNKALPELMMTKFICISLGCISTTQSCQVTLDISQVTLDISRVTLTGTTTGSISMSRNNVDCATYCIFLKTSPVQKVKSLHHQNSSIEIGLSDHTHPQGWRKSYSFPCTLSCHYNTVLHFLSYFNWNSCSQTLHTSIDLVSGIFFVFFFIFF